MKTTLTVIVLLFFVPISYAIAQGNAVGKKIPIIYCTDLFHPHDDPDDHFDLACMYSIGEFDLLGVILDQGAKQEQKPGWVAVAQLNHITGRNIPYTIGLGSKLKSPMDKGLDQPEKYQGGIELLVSKLKASKTPVTIVAVGSLRDVAAAYNRYPELFKSKVERLLIFIGEGSLESHIEYNVKLDENSYICIMNSGLPVYWVPCFDGGVWQNKGKASFWKSLHSDLLKDVSEPVMKYFTYALLRKNEADPVTFVEQEPKKEETEKVLGMIRNLWCTAVFPYLAGRQYVRQDGKVIAIPADVPCDKKDLVEPFRFEDVSVYVNEKGAALYETSERSHTVKLFKVTDLKQYKEMMTSVTAQLLSELDD